MATKTFEELRKLAIQIRDEKANKQNTALRIGNFLLSSLDKMESMDIADIAEAVLQAETAADEAKRQADIVAQSGDIVEEAIKQGAAAEAAAAAANAAADKATNEGLFKTQQDLSEEEQGQVKQNLGIEDLMASLETQTIEGFSETVNATTSTKSVDNIIPPSIDFAIVDLGSTDGRELPTTPSMSVVLAKVTDDGRVKMQGYLKTSHEEYNIQVVSGSAEKYALNVNIITDIETTYKVFQIRYLSSFDGGKFKGSYGQLSQLQAAYTTAGNGSYAFVGNPRHLYEWVTNAWTDRGEFITNVDQVIDAQSERAISNKAVSAKLTELDNQTKLELSYKLDKTNLPLKEIKESGIYFVDEQGNAFMVYSNERGLDVSKISKETADKVLYFLSISQELGSSKTAVISQKAVTDAINNIKATSEVVEDGAFLCNEKGEVFARFVNGKFEAVGMNSYDPEPTEKLDIDITDVIPVVEGYTTELYNEQLIDVPNAFNYYFVYTCNKGKQYERKWSIDAVKGDAGDYDLKIEVFNLKNELVGSKTVTLRIISKIDELSEDDVQVVAVGDSWHSPGIQTRTLVDNFSALYDGIYVCKSIGTQTNNQNSDERNYTEGRSGWRSDQYISQGWASQFVINVSGISVIPERKKKYRLTSQYTHFFFGLEVEETDLSLSSDGVTYEGTILFNYYGVSGGQNYEINVIPIILTAYDGSDYGESTGGMSGDSEIRGSKATIPSSTGNPFWNSEKGELDFNNYCKIHSLKPTIFYIALGTNQSDDAVNIPTFITAMRNTPYDETVGIDWSNIPVIVAQQQHWGNIRWDVVKKQYIFNKHKLLENAIKALSDNQVYLMPFAQCFDSRYNFGAKEVAISPRNTEYSEKIPTDYVHCTAEGYKRCGDLIFFFIMNVLYNNLNK